MEGCPPPPLQLVNSKFGDGVVQELKWLSSWRGSGASEAQEAACSVAGVAQELEWLRNLRVSEGGVAQKMTQEVAWVSRQRCLGTGVAQELAWLRR